MSNGLFDFITISAVAAHVAALLLAFVAKRGALPLLAVNGAVAVGLLLQIGAHGHLFDEPLDWQRLALAAFELLAIALAFAGYARSIAARYASCAIFGIHFLASIAAMVFALTFKMTRLI